MWFWYSYNFCIIFVIHICNFSFFCHGASLRTPRHCVDLVWWCDRLVPLTTHLSFLAEIVASLLDNGRRGNPRLLLLLLVAKQAAVIIRAMWRHTVVRSLLQPLDLTSLILEPHFHLYRQQHTHTHTHSVSTRTQSHASQMQPKLKPDKFFAGNPSQNYGVSVVIWNGSHNIT